ncbi:MAG: stage III sporulation protein AF [Clostridia bacterium]|nr:stage III sporulation protein AF [Clostridia bacterium]
MIEWITNWAQGIIIAVIIATIIEMILPNGSCKKYIKVVIGVYILFSIISPVISKITGKGFNISEELNLEEFYTEVDSKAIYNSLDKNNSNNIMDIYVSNLKSDIISKLKNKGYETTSCEIEIKDEETYEIKSLKLTLKKISENNDNEEKKSSGGNNKVEEIKEVNNINIKIGESNNKIQNDESLNNEDNNSGNKDYKSDLTVYEKNKVKEYLETTYEINKKNININ